MTNAHDETKPVTDAQARKTALIVAGTLLLLAAWNYHRGRQTFVSVLGGIGVALIVIGLLVPPLARAFHTFWMRVATLLGWVNSRVLLSLMFYGVLAPYNLVGRLIRRDPLRRRAAPSESYWIKRKQTRQTREQFERTF
ncbi:MAG: hypothetical protein DMF64_20745 [Acidobacteria bacterium]|nr:MAG: hypothetical protein DMF64_20745 [Acidobacteriota bacterium]